MSQENKRLTSETKIAPFAAMKQDINNTLYNDLIEIENTLIAAGAKPGIDYDWATLIAFTQSQAYSEGLSSIAEEIKRSFYDSMLGSIGNILTIMMDPQHPAGLGGINEIAASIDRLTSAIEKRR